MSDYSDERSDAIDRHLHVCEGVHFQYDPQLLLDMATNLRRFHSGGLVGWLVGIVVLLGHQTGIKPSDRMPKAKRKYIIIYVQKDDDNE